MRSVSLMIPAFLLVCVFTVSIVAQPAEDRAEDLSLTVYSSADPAGFDPQQFIAQQRGGYNPQYAGQVPGFGVVKEVRTLDLEEGVNEVNFTDVAAFIDPTTVSFTDLANAEGTTVLEQQFLFDLVSPDKLLEKYIDREVTLRVPLGEEVQTVTGTLLSATGGRLVLQTDEGVRMVNQNEAQVQLGELPGGLITKPTLQWLLNAAEGGEREVRTTYQTDGLTWKADYNLVLNEDDTEADLGAWVTLMNLSGASYPDARLKLIAGDVQRVEPDRRRAGRYGAQMMMEQQAQADVGFEEEAFFEYHLYTLPRRTNVSQNTTQQITLFPTARGAEVEKVFVYYGLPVRPYRTYGANPNTDRDLGIETNKKVDVYIRFDNEEENELGMPLPRGKVRVYKEDPEDETLEFVGEDLIDHTPRDEEVLIKTGQAFDIVGERIQTDFTRVGNMIEESFRIELRNHKEDEPVEVIVKENLYRWVNWEITQQSDEFEQIDARTIHFNVEVPAGGQKVVEYTVRYTW